LLAAMLASSAGLLLGFAAGRPIEVRVGPDDESYFRGFRLRWQPGTTLRWARTEAEIEVPVEVRRPTRATLLAARPGLDPTVIAVRQGRTVVAEFTAGAGRVLETFELAPGAARIALRAQEAATGKSLQVTSLTIRPEGAAVVPSLRVLAQVSLGSAVLCAALLFVGWRPRTAAVLCAACLGVPLAIGSLADPFATLHLVLKIGILAPAAAGIGIALMPRALARPASPILAAALLLRLAVVFHPQYYFQDVAIHRDVAAVAIEKGPLELWRHMPEYQQSYQLGLATVAGQWKPFPYPPTFYTLAALSPLGSPEDVVKALGALSSGIVVALMMALAARIGGASAGLRAGVLAMLLPADLTELLRASYPALLGRALDTGLVVLLASRWEWLATRLGVAVVALWIAACGLTYNAGPVHLTIFLPLLLAVSSLTPALPARSGLVASAVVGGALASSYYAGALGEVARHALSSAQANVARPGLTVADVSSGWDEIGVPLLLVGAAGLAGVLRQRWASPEGRVISAWAAYIVAISIPVALFPEVFGYFRRLYFAQALGPLLASLPAVRRDWIGFSLGAALVLWSLLGLVELVMPFFVSHSGQIGV
jgi:hypothetical protein